MSAMMKEEADAKTRYSLAWDNIVGGLFNGAG